MKPPAETLEDVLKRMGDQVLRLQRRPSVSTSVQPTTVAAVQNTAALPQDATPGAAFIVIDDEVVVVRTLAGWSEHDPDGAAWTLPSYLRSRGVV